MKLIAKAEISQGKGAITKPGEAFDVDDKTGVMLVERGLASDPSGKTVVAEAAPVVDGDKAEAKKAEVKPEDKAEDKKK